MVGSRNAETNGALFAYTAAAAVARKRLLCMLTVASILSFNWQYAMPPFIVVVRDVMLSSDPVDSISDDRRTV